MDYSNKLPCSVKPKEDELFSSWLVRLAYHHELKSHSFYKILFPKYQIWTRDIDKMAPIGLINELSIVTLSSTEEMLNTTLKSYENKLYLKYNSNGNLKWILPLGIFHRIRKNNGLVYCPICLKNDSEPYFRKHWRLSFSVICTKCGVNLHEKCPKCKKPVVFFRNDIGNKNKQPPEKISNCYNCGYDLSKSPIVFASSKCIEYQKKLFKILNNGLNEEIIYPHLYFDVLHQIIKVLLNRKAKVFNNKIKKHNTTFEALPIDTRRVILKQAFWLLEDYPNRFIKFFKKKNIKSTILLRDFQGSPFWYYETVYENFYVTNINRKF